MAGIHLLMRANRLCLITLLAATLIIGCKRQTEDYQTEALSEYLPLQVGKYITYKLDSTVFTNFGRNTERHVYQEKDIVDAKLPDALGRPSYRIFRFLRDSAGTQPWKPAGSYFITPLEKTVELMEDNLRFVKLALPITQDFTWKGNEFLPDEPYSALYSFNNDFDISTWDYMYSSLDQTEVINGKTLNNVLTVDGIDDVFNYPITDPSGFAYVNRLQDKYAKGIGLIYQEQTMWEYQPNTGGQGGGFKIGFGVKRSMIDHN